MQRIRFNRRLIGIIAVVFVLVLLIVADQITKLVFTNLKNSGEWKGTDVIPGFLSFKYIINTGAAYGLLDDVSWGQTFLKVLTGIVIVPFVGVFVWSIIKKRNFLSYTMAFIIAGTLGNFIDRLRFDGVVDFITITLGDFVPFGIFNLADVFLSAGLILFILYILFFSPQAIFKFKKKNDKKDIDDTTK